MSKMGKVFIAIDYFNMFFNLLFVFLTMTMTLVLFVPFLQLCTEYSIMLQIPIIIININI